MNSASLMPSLPLEQKEAPEGVAMIVQLVVIILVFFIASSFALTIAGLSLSVFSRFLKRADAPHEK